MLAIYIEPLVSHKAFLGAQALVLARSYFGKVREDEGLHLDGLTFQGKRFLGLGLRCVMVAEEGVCRFKHVPIKTNLELSKTFLAA